MDERNPFLEFTRRFEELGLKYMVTGSVAAAIYSEPRFTNDIDIVALLREGDIARLVEAFPEEEFYVPPPEVIRVELAREQRGHFNRARRVRDRALYRQDDRC